MKKPNLRTVMDDRLIRREYYNKNNFAVHFKLENDQIPYIVNSGISPGLPFYRLEPGKWLVLNHSFFLVTAADPGVQFFDLVINYGDQIGIGNTRPSRPELTPKYY